MVTTDIGQRVRALEARMDNTMATCADLARVEERITALSNVVDLYIQRKDFHNDEFARASRLVHDELNRRLSLVETSNTQLQTRWALIGALSGAAFGGVVSIAVALVTGLVGR